MLVFYPCPLRLRMLTPFRRPSCIVDFPHFSLPADDENEPCLWRLAPRPRVGAGENEKEGSAEADPCEEPPHKNASSVLIAPFRG